MSSETGANGGKVRKLANAGTSMKVQTRWKCGNIFNIFFF